VCQAPYTQLRDLRYAVRKAKELSKQPDEENRQSAIYNLAYVLANASNEFLSTAESGLISMLSAEPDSHFGHANAFGFERYFDLVDADPEKTKFRFIREQYFATKRILLITGNTNALVHQENYLEIWQDCAPVMLELFSKESFGEEEICQLAAAYTIATVNAHPVRSPESFEHPHLDAPIDTNIFLGATLALVAGVTVGDDQEPESDVIYKSCIAASMSCFESLSKAFQQDNPEPALLEFYANIMSHLP